jgi:hypothetical protein
MSVSINIPEDLYREAKAIAEAQHLSVDDVIVSAFAEQLAAWERLKQKAARGRREEYLKVLEKVPDVEPEDYDRI